ncbi:MAG: beta-ketoacyl-ACP synthase 3 [Planctomycetota bacterium]|nr:beta-ketoacyl-ACP synthase 3 [Planctomycetota bacterium]
MVSANQLWTRVSSVPRRSSCGPMPATILGTGAFVPPGIVDNASLVKSRSIDTTPEWIASKTGILERRFAADDVAASDLATEAALRALEAAGLSPDEVDLFIVATSTPDYTMPSTACLVQRNLGAEGGMAFDVVNACAGFVTALDIAVRCLQTNTETAVVIGVDIGSRLVDPHDRTTSVFFGDGAGAVVLGSEGAGTVLASRVQSRGDNESLNVPVGGTMTMNGKAVWNFATHVLPDTVRYLCGKAQVPVEDIKLLVPHQANENIIRCGAAEVGIPMDRVAVNIERYGNTIAASVPIALDEALRAGRAISGDHVMLVGFGAGLSWGGNLLRL